MNLHDQINSHRYINLAHITEPADNQLRLVIEEVGSSGRKEELNIHGHTIKDIEAITSDERHFTYEVLFSDYIIYSVRNESFTGGDKEEKFSGKLFCIYTRSHFLDYLSKATFATSDYPGPFSHYGFNCLNHIVDIASQNFPEIKIIKTPSQGIETNGG